MQQASHRPRDSVAVDAEGLVLKDRRHICVGGKGASENVVFGTLPCDGLQKAQLTILGSYAVS